MLNGIKGNKAFDTRKHLPLGENRTIEKQTIHFNEKLKIETVLMLKLRSKHQIHLFNSYIKVLHNKNVMVKKNIFIQSTLSS